MHPPDFSPTHRLSDWPECRIEANCPCSGGRAVVLPVRLLLQGGDRTFRNVVSALRCKQCGGRPAPVYLVAGLHRQFCYGPPPNWALELVPPTER